MAAPKARTGKRIATLADLKSKRAREDVVAIPLGDGEEVNVRLRALSSRAYDALEAKYPPTKEQREKQAVFDIDLFAPALISACAVEPVLSFEDAQELYESDQWAAGEIGGLFFAAQRLCNSGLDTSFNAAG